MSDHDVRAGIQQAKLGETGLTILACEAFAIAAILGFATQSWAFAILAFIGMAALFGLAAKSESVSGVVALLTGAAWGVAAFFVALQAEADVGLAVAVAALLGLIGAGAHHVGFQHLRDIQRAKG